MSTDNNYAMEVFPSVSCDISLGQQADCIRVDVHTIRHALITGGLTDEQIADTTIRVVDNPDDEWVSYNSAEINIPYNPTIQDTDRSDILPDANENAALPALLASQSLSQYLMKFVGYRIEVVNENLKEFDDHAGPGFRDKAGNLLTRVGLGLTACGVAAAIIKGLPLLEHDKAFMYSGSGGMAYFLGQRMLGKLSKTELTNKHLEEQRRSMAWERADDYAKEYNQQLMGHGTDEGPDLTKFTVVAIPKSS